MREIKNEKVKTITVSNWFNTENFDEKVEEFIKTVNVLAIEYSCSVDNVNGVLAIVQSAMIIYNDKETDNE